MTAVMTRTTASPIMLPVMTSDEESDDDDSKCDLHRYSKFINSLLLEDEEPPESCHVDWVKGKGAGRKAYKGRPP